MIVVFAVTAVILSMVFIWKEIRRFGWPLRAIIWFPLAIAGSYVIVALLTGYVQKPNLPLCTAMSVRDLLTFNLFLQFTDCLVSYQVFALGAIEANPVVAAAIVHWGYGWGINLQQSICVPTIPNICAQTQPALNDYSGTDRDGLGVRVRDCFLPLATPSIDLGGSAHRHISPLKLKASTTLVTLGTFQEVCSNRRSSCPPSHSGTGVAFLLDENREDNARGTFFSVHCFVHRSLANPAHYRVD